MNARGSRRIRSAMSRWLRDATRVSVVLALVAGCNGPELMCGAGTSAVDGVCVIVDGGVTPSSDAAVPVDAARDGTDAARTADAGTDASLPSDAGTDAWRPIADAGHDAWIGDAGPLVLRDGDTLMIHPTSATVVPGLAVCPELTVLHADGTTLSVRAGAAATITSTPFDTTIAEVAQAEDCVPLPGYDASPGVGIVSLSPGTTTAQFTVSSMGRLLTATLAIDVVDGAVTIDTPQSVVVPVGGSADESLVVTPHHPDGSYVDISAYSRIVPRLFSGLMGTPSGIFSVGPGPNYYTLEVTGIAVGMGHVQGTYGVAGRTAPITSSQMVSVVAPGTLSSIPLIYYYSAEGVFQSQGAPSSMAPGDCFEMRALGMFRNASGETYDQRLTSGVTYSVTGPGHIAAGPPAQICADAHGEMAVQACDGAICTTEHVPVITRALVTSFTVSPMDAMFMADPFWVFSGCAPLQAVIHYTDGTTQDVTNSYATFWSVSGPAGSLFVYRQPLGGGAPPTVDASGNPCFGTMGMASPHGSLPVVASYGGIPSNVVNFRW